MKKIFNLSLSNLSIQFFFKKIKQAIILYLRKEIKIKTKYLLIYDVDDFVILKLYQGNLSLSSCKRCSRLILFFSWMKISNATGCKNSLWRKNNTPEKSLFEIWTCGRVVKFRFIAANQHDIVRLRLILSMIIYLV